MLQLALRDAVHDAVLCLAKDCFEDVFEIADEATREVNCGNTELMQTIDFKELMVHASVAALVCHVMTAHALREAGFWPEPAGKPSPYLRKVRDTHGIYRLWILEERYARLAGHVPGKTDAYNARARKLEVVEWYLSRPASLLEVVSSDARKTRPKGRIRKFFEHVNDIQHGYASLAMQLARQQTAPTP